MLETLKVRLRSNFRLLIGIIGFGIIAYAIAGLYVLHRQARDAQILLGTRYESAFTTAGEEYLILFGIGVVVVLIASR